MLTETRFHLANVNSACIGSAFEHRRGIVEISILFLKSMFFQCAGSEHTVAQPKMNFLPIPRKNHFLARALREWIVLTAHNQTVLVDDPASCHNQTDIGTEVTSMQAGLYNIWVQNIIIVVDHQKVASCSFYEGIRIPKLSQIPLMTDVSNTRITK